jgi:hypothetical protein
MRNQTDVVPDKLLDPILFGPGNLDRLASKPSQDNPAARRWNPRPNDNGPKRDGLLQRVATWFGHRES